MSMSKAVKSALVSGSPQGSICNSSVLWAGLLGSVLGSYLRSLLVGRHSDSLPANGKGARSFSGP